MIVAAKAARSAWVGRRGDRTAVAECTHGPRYRIHRPGGEHQTRRGEGETERERSRAFVGLYLLGSLTNSPQWLLDLEPFAHVPHVGLGDFHAAPLLWLLAIDVVLIAMGVTAFRRRDLR